MGKIEVVAEFKDRLNSALKIRDMRPIDLVNKTGISESTISQYRSGYAKPKEKKLSLLANALNVNPTWLMGLDVEMENLSTKEFLLTKEESILIDNYRNADDELKRMVNRILAYERGLKDDD